jgi:hypothetical protein
MAKVERGARGRMVAGLAARCVRRGLGLMVSRCRMVRVAVVVVAAVVGAVVVGRASRPAKVDRMFRVDKVFSPGR